MEIPAVISFSLLGTASVFIAFKQWRVMWRGEERSFAARLRPTPRGWAWGDIAWRAWVRSGFISTFFGFVGLIALPLAITGEEGTLTRTIGYRVVFVVAWLGFFLLVLLVVLFNRPRFVVLPHLRNEPGVVGEVLSKLHRRHRQGGAVRHNRTRADVSPDQTDRRPRD